MRPASRALAAGVLAIAAASAPAQLYNSFTPHYVQAADALQAASVLVDGHELSTATKQETGDGKTVMGHLARRYWYEGRVVFTTSDLLIAMGEYDAWAQPGRRIADGIDLTEAVAFAKARFFHRDALNPGFGEQLIDQAWQVAIGRLPTAAERAPWRQKLDARQTWYAPMFLAVWTNARNDPVEHRAIITRAYSSALCRIPTAAEVTAELGFDQSYKPTLRRAVALFLSPANEAELTKRTAYFLQSAGKTASPGYVAMWVATARQRRLGCLALKNETGGKWKGET